MKQSANPSLRMHTLALRVVYDDQYHRLDLGELKLGEVRDTNRPTLLTAIKGSGFEAVDLGIASDK